ncbi:hypothetical protein ICL81_10850 [Leucobacter sp. cx-328]|uniref:prealbumin-like fold domain-containing protein n=1 Tax=unclassified Leucobacter TaxID=2621730 RepID=UPI00165E0C66|nr:MULTISPECIES: prealbumin-like fold domain-containing protein [unclassified Leucobacter]MBC9944997.1 hypothetical protein [Leucobacter sp. cx-328]
MNTKQRGLGIALAGATVLSLGLLTASPALAEDAPADSTAANAAAVEDVPSNCTLSETHFLYDTYKEPALNLFVKRTITPDPNVPFDPDNPQQFFRSGTGTFTNQTHHVFYEPVMFIRDKAVIQDVGPGAVTVWLVFDPATMAFRSSTNVKWLPTWEPITGRMEVKYRDTDTPVILFDASDLNLTNGGSRPGYPLPNIAPGATQTVNYKTSTTAPTRGGGAYYGYSWHANLAGQTCLPVPTVAPVTDSSTLLLEGTGTTQGDVITLSDDLGNDLGTATVQPDLTWKVDLAAPVDPTAQKVVAVATDIFGFTGTAETALLGSVSWTKASSENSELLDGSAWNISGPDGFTLDVTDGGQRDTNAEAGQLEIESLKLGKYVLTETVAPQGFVRSEKPIEFEIDTNNWVIDLGQVLNDPIKAVDPVEPVDPADPKDPADPEKPGDTAKPTGQTKAPAGGGLAHTGADSLSLLGFGAAGLVLAGLGATYLASRRKARNAA